MTASKSVSPRLVYSCSRFSEEYGEQRYFDQFQKELMDVVTALGKEKKYLLILEKAIVPYNDPVVEVTVQLYLQSLRQSGIDTLILGCTHYPLLKKAIRKFMGSGVKLVDSAEEVAKNVGAILKRQSLARKTGKGIHSFFVTDAPDRFIKVGQRFLGEKVESAVRIER